jgi:hypothetical protein
MAVFLGSRFETGQRGFEIASGGMSADLLTYKLPTVPEFGPKIGYRLKI